MTGSAPANSTLTAVPGLAVGHAADEEAETGCTVVLGPYRAAVDVRGLASGTRQIDSLRSIHIAPRADAILLTGGSAYGLAAADGVAAWLEERGRGFPTGETRVAIVPSAVIYDLATGRSDRRPDPAMGRAACDAASDAPVAEGRVGVGRGATVGKLLGRDRATPGGLGSWAVRVGDHVVGALVVVNAFGDVVDREGRIIAGARRDDDGFLDTADYIRTHGRPHGFGPPGAHTTLGIVATDRPLNRGDLEAVARQAMNAIVRRIVPANTQFDGDLVFACSTGEDARDLPVQETLRIGLWAEWVLSEAITRAVDPSVTGDAEPLATD